MMSRFFKELSCRSLSFSMLLLLPCIAVGQSDSTYDQKRVADLISQMEGLSDAVESTRLDGRTEPFSFSGEGRVKGIYHSLQDYPVVMRKDRSYLQAGWEGNESMLRIGMRAIASRYVNLYAKIGFQTTFVGDYGNRWAEDRNMAGFRAAQARHDKSDATVQIHEELLGAMAIRTPLASGWIRMGGLMWIEGSPLTIWKSQPRTFAWDYLPYEWEQSTSSYYDYNMARGEKSGRAAWNKKPFNGINFESIDLPWNLYCNLLYGLAERFDNFEREYVDFSTDIGYTDQSASRGLGIGDTYRHLLYGRLAKAKLGQGLTAGLNYAGIRYDRNIALNGNFQKAFKQSSVGSFCKEPNVYSADVFGTINEKLSIRAELAASAIDTIHFDYDSLKNWTTRSSSSNAVPALFASLNSKHLFPITLDAIYAGRGYHSPFSFIMPVDAFMPYGANLLGAGRFINNSEASPYFQNTAGAALTVAPNLKGYGHLRFNYGQHFQIQESRDLLFFPYRLNGMDFFGLFQSSYNRWGNNLWDASLNNTEAQWWKTPNAYQKRIGDESYRFTDYLRPFGPESGGLRTNYLSTFEGFVAYEDSAQANGNLADSTLIGQSSKFLPEHRKFSFNFDMDASYDIGPLIGYPHAFFLGWYAALNSVSTSFLPLALSDKGQSTLLWSIYLRFEPAIAVTDKFYVIGIVGFENWRSQKAYMAKQSTDYFASSTSALHVPIDYRDYAYGIGFDWDMFARSSLHSRIKWMQHDDINYPANNWATPVISGEVKLWY